MFRADRVVQFGLFEAVPPDAPVIDTISSPPKEKGPLVDCILEFDRLSHKGDTLRFSGFAGGMCLVKL